MFHMELNQPDYMVARYNRFMRYEQRNAIGLVLLIAGALLIVLALLLLGRILAFVVVGIAIIFIGVGFFMMTRGFSEADRDHPDYERYRRRIEGDE